MTQLLISVRNTEEAHLACDAGADLIDIKEPGRGPLGAADGSTVRAIVAAVAQRVQVSAALGELLHDKRVLAPADLKGLAYAKCGLAGCAARADWMDLWSTEISRFPMGVAPVAVVYADDAAAAPDVESVVAAAERVGAPVVLIDTHDKSQGSLMVHWSLDKVRHIVCRIHHSGLKVALAGSLDALLVEQLLPLGPDIIAARGAACSGGRTGRLDPVLVMRLAELVHSSCWSAPEPRMGAMTPG
jgi:uncharacterized protein (UPF0264 family)